MSKPKPPEHSSQEADIERSTGRYGPKSKLVEYIYGITFEIWEEKGVELIRQYYAADIEMFALSGISRGVDAIVQGTYDTLAAFPDRLLLTENVVWSQDLDGEYSSHRILSPMTNLGPSIYGPATGKKVQVRTIADCFVQQGVITREWLIRDTLPIVRQLGFDAHQAAKLIAASYTAETKAWFAEEIARIPTAVDVDHEWVSFAREVLGAQWITGELTAALPHFTVLHPDPTTVISGLPALTKHYAELRAQFSDAALSIDHIAVQPWSHHGFEVAIRWTLCATHSGEYLGQAATNKRVFILGSTHWRVVDQKVMTDCTVFDGIGVLAQLV